MKRDSLNNTEAEATIPTGHNRLMKSVNDYLRQVSVLMPQELLQLLDQEYFIKGWSKAALIRESIECLFTAIENERCSLDDSYVLEQMASMKGSMVMLNTYIYARHIDLLDEFAHTYNLTRSDLIRYAVARYAKWIVAEHGKDENKTTS